MESKDKSESKRDIVNDSVRAFVSVSDRYCLESLEGCVHEEGGRQQGNPRLACREQGEKSTTQP